MARPQLEDGYTRIANELMEALMRTNLSAYQSRVLWAIWRRTYGYGKKQDFISNSQLADMTGLQKSHISRTVAELIQRNIVTRIGNKIAFIKDYQGWRELPKRVTDTNPGNKVTDWGYRRYQSGALQKKKRCKERYMSSGDDAAPNGACPHRAIVALFHEVLPALPRVRVWNDRRKGHLAARWREDAERQSLEWWKDFFGYIGKSAFLTGKVAQLNRKSFMASLDWIVQPENFAKILEGKYE